MLMKRARRRVWPWIASAVVLAAAAWLLLPESPLPVRVLPVTVGIVEETVVASSVGTVEAERDAVLAANTAARADAAPEPVALLLALKGIGANAAAVLWTEAFYREFANRRQIAAYAGLAATPWRSGNCAREQGVSKAGNPRLRTTLIQLAWLWLRHQGQSALACWFKAHSQRGRKSAIVALARKLLVALWKYVTQGIVIAGAVMKSAA